MYKTNVKVQCSWNISTEMFSSTELKIKRRFVESQLNFQIG